MEPRFIPFLLNRFLLNAKHHPSSDLSQNNLMEVTVETVGALEAKANFLKLLDRVAKGERICIQKHGVPVAILQPAAPSIRKPTRETIEQIREFRKGVRLDGLSVRGLLEEKRR